MSVTYALDAQVAVITADDGKANALSHDTLAEMREALDKAEQEATAVLLAGREGRFSAGFDLSIMSGGEDQMRALVIDGARFLAKLLTYPLPVVAACTGHALAAGALVLLSCDHRIAAAGPFKIGLNEVAIGMPLPQFGVEIARYRLPPSQLDAALLGEVFDPDAAVAVGFVDRVVDAESVLAEGLTAAHRYSQLRSGAVARTKQAARGAMAQEILDTVEADMATISGPRPS
jgi:enoyl-CoA hydratase